MKTKKQKELLVESLKKIPIVSYACKSVGIGRNSYYRWRSDKKFAEISDRAIEEGIETINDLAESQLISGINNGNTTLTMFWLRSRHGAYQEKLKISGKIKSEEKLTKAQKTLLRKALRLASFKE
jgi:hypothetical protein